MLVVPCSRQGLYGVGRHHGECVREEGSPLETPQDGGGGGRGGEEGDWQEGSSRRQKGSSQEGRRQKGTAAPRT